MPTQREKIASFLQKVAASGSPPPAGESPSAGLRWPQLDINWDKGLWGETAPFWQKGAPLHSSDILAQILPYTHDIPAIPAEMLPNRAHIPGLVERAQKNDLSVLDSYYPGLREQLLNAANTSDIANAYNIKTRQDDPGFLKNYVDAMRRGHLGAVAGTAAAGAAALLAGVLTYNMLKNKAKKGKGDVVSMRGQRKAASVMKHAGLADFFKSLFRRKANPLAGAASASPLQRARAFVRAHPVATSLTGAGALGAGTAVALSGGRSEPPAELPPEPPKPFAAQYGLPTTGNNWGDAAIAAGGLGLAGYTMYKLYKALRGDDD